MSLILTRGDAIFTYIYQIYNENIKRSISRCVGFCVRISPIGFRFQSKKYFFASAAPVSGCGTSGESDAHKNRHHRLQGWGVKLVLCQEYQSRWPGVVQLEWRRASSIRRLGRTYETKPAAVSDARPGGSDPKRFEGVGAMALSQKRYCFVVPDEATEANVVCGDCPDRDRVCACSAIAHSLREVRPSALSSETRDHGAFHCRQWE